MINIIIPIVNNNEIFLEKFGTPKNLTVIKQKTLIELVIENFKDILTNENNIIFIISSVESNKFQTDQVIKNSLPNANIVYAYGITAGAVASLLLCYDRVNLDYPLLILGGDQLIYYDKKTLISDFAKSKSNYLLTVFLKNSHQNSDTPYSFARVNGNVIYFIEEKKPISEFALTGIYYFSNPIAFFTNCKKYIINNPEQEIYFLSQVANTMIEDGHIFINFTIKEIDYVKFSKSKLLKGEFK